MVGPKNVAVRDVVGVALVVLAMAAFTAAVYVVVVLGGGVLIGRTDAPHPGLSVLATGIVALGFEPVLTRVRPWATRTAHGGRRPPHEVLAGFLAQVSGMYPTDEVPSRMARLLAEGTGAAYAQVWPVLDGRLTLAQTWPPQAAARADPPDLGEPGRSPDGRRATPVYHAGELLGVLLVQQHERQPLTPVEEKLLAGLAAQAGLVLRTVRLRAELARQLTEISDRAAELQASRQRIVAAQDEERRRLERDIHDGAQQHLVALAVNLRLAQTLLARHPDMARNLFTDLRTAATDTIDTLTDLSRGIYPRLLTDAGLVPALKAVAETCPVPVTITADPITRPPAETEAASYFCCVEALQNAAKHAAAEHIAIEVRRRPGELTLAVSDDGVGFDTDGSGAGSGLVNMRDRIESVGGRLTVASQPGRGTVVTAHIPADQPPVTSAHVAASRSGPKTDLAR